MAPPRPRKKNMPGLTLDTSPINQTPSRQSSNISSNSRSESPPRPTYSPITPVLGPATSLENSPQDAPHQRQTYTHSQPNQTIILQPPPVPIDFESNPDVLAMKSAIAILQLQAKNTRNDIQTIKQVKDRALEDPEAFVKAVTSGEITSRSGTLFAPSGDDDEDDDSIAQAEDKDKQTWPKLPIPQNVVRCPPINWHQYSVEGEVLNKLHADQQARPSEGTPQQLGSDGQLQDGGEGQKRGRDVAIAAPYQPGKDKIERSAGKKGGKK